MPAALTETVLIPGGEFRMGDEQGNSNERPPIRVIVRPFQLDIHPVTNAQYRRFLEDCLEWRKENVSRAQAEECYLNLWTGLEHPEGLDH